MSAMPWPALAACLALLVAVLTGVVVRQRHRLARQTRKLELSEATERAAMQQAREQTDRNQRLARTQMLREVAEIANAALNQEDLLNGVLHAVCASVGWPLGHAYVLDDDGRLVPTPCWYVAPGTEEQFERVIEVTMRSTFAPGEGILGGILKDQQARWFNEIKVDPAMPRTQGFKDLPVRGAVGFPVMVGDEVRLVLEFFSDRSIPEGEELRSLLSSVCAQISRVLERNSARDALGEANARLIQSNTDLQEFTHIASHDLKEPLRGIRTNVSFLLEDYADLLPEKGRAQLDRLVFLTERMQELIDDLLSYSRLGSGALCIEPTDLNTLISDVCARMQDTLDADNVTVRAEPLPPVPCDATQVRELFHNLIANGMKYNDKADKHIEIGATCGDPLVFFVRDNGIGIDKEFHEDVFQMFKRLNGNELYGPGSGAGLAFVKKIVDRHEGRVWIESEPGDGATVYFTLTPG